MEGHSINGTDAPGGAAAAAATAAAPVSSGSSFSFLNDDDFFDSAVEPEPVQQPPPPQPPAQQSRENEQPPQWQQQPVQHNSPQQWQQQQQLQQQQDPSPQQSPGAESFVSRSPPPQSFSEPRSAAPTSTASPHSHSHSHSHALSPAHAAPALAPHAGPLLEMPWPESPAASPGAAQRRSPGVSAAAAAAPLPTYSPFPVLDQQPGSGGTPGGAYPAVQQQQQPSQQHQQPHSVPLDKDGWQQWPAAIAAGPVSGSAPAPRPVSPVAPSVPFRSQPPPVSPTVAALPPHNPYAERPASAAQQQPQQQQRPQAYQQQPQQQQQQQLFQQSPASQSPMMQQQPLSHSPSQGAFPGPGHSRNQSGSVPPQFQLQQQSPSPNVPVGLPVQPGSAEIICPYCTVRLRFPIGAELVRCGSCNSISRLPPQMQTSPPQPQQVGQQQLAPQSGAASLPLQAGMPLPQPMMASQAPATRVRFQCSGCAQWLATDVGPDGSAVARCPSCQTLMRPMMTLAPPPPQQLTPAQLQAFQQQQRQSMPLQQQQQQQQLQQQQMQQQRPQQQQLSGAQMQYPANAHLLANPAMLPSQQQQQQQPPQQLTVLQQQEYLLAQAAANKAARERQQRQGQAQPSNYAQGPPLPTQRVLSAGASFVGSAQTIADPRYQQQQQLQRPQSVRRPSGDYSGLGSANFAHSNSGPQQQRFAPAPRPSPSLQPSLSDDFVDAPYTPMNGAPSMAAGGGLGSQMAALHHAHSAAPPMSFSAQSHSQSRPQWSEGKEESEAQVAADAEFARQMAERLNALDVSGRVDSEGAPIDQAGRSQAVRRVRAAAGDDKALPLLANPL